LYFNARSLLPKFDELAATAEALQPTVICIVEACLSDQVTESENFIMGYVTDQITTGMGEELLCIVQSCIFTELLLTSPQNLELCLSSPH